MYRPLVLAAALALAPMVASAVTHPDKYVTILEGAPSNAECFYFQLNGVSAADSAVPASGPFFALHSSHPGYKQIFALLLSAKLSGLRVTVTTTGAAAHSSCGAYVGVHDVYLP